LASGASDLITKQGSSEDRTGSSSARPTYTHVAALQELALVIDKANSSSSVDGANSSSSSNGSSRKHALLAAPGSRNSSRNGTSSRGGAVVVRKHRQRTESGAAAAAPLNASAASSSSSRSTLDLDPPFRPLVDRYIALLPPRPAVGHLMMSSSRAGDVVVVDATACGELNSTR
jgi:hypothetical protein